MRILLPSIFIFGLLTIPIVFSSSTSFPDTKRHVYSEAIDYIHDQGTIDGYPDGYFRPQGLINRAELIKIMVNSTIDEEDIFTDELSPDVDSEEWFAPYVSTGLRHDIISGYPDGTFQAANNITFVETAKVIVLAFDLPYEEDAGAPWYEGYVQALESYGAIPSTIHYLDHEVTRGDVTEIIYRLQEGITEEASTSYETLVTNAELEIETFDYIVDGSTYVVLMDAKRVHMNVMTGNDSIRPTECDYPNHCVAEIQAESFSSYLDRSMGSFLVNGAYFDSYTYELDGVNYHETGGDIIINGEMQSMFGWENAFGDGGMLAQMNDGSYQFFYPIRDWIDEYDSINFAISNYPLVLNGNEIINEETYVEQDENDYKFWISARKAGLALSADGETIIYMNTVGTVTDLGQAMQDYGAEWGFQLDSGASLGFANEGSTIFSPGRNIVTTVEFY
ncbi:MAG: S-layer homology domain-containing protein [Candidatus Peregrinibacteria bacterium]|nr:S-layer homology domain-containing protein [Candidatus Peregrinibacteria bacterium]